MRLPAPTLALAADEVRITAVLRPEIDAGPPVELEVGVPRTLIGAVDLTPTPFVPVAGVVALLTGEALHLDGPVPDRLVTGAGTAIVRLAPWMGRAPVDVVAAVDGPFGPPPERRRGVGLFFTRGVDSWASLRRHQGRVTHLLAIDDIEPRLPADDAADVWAGHQQVAAALDLPLVRVTTNARSVLDPLAAWDLTHGAVLASIGLLLSPLLETVIVAGTHRRGHDWPWGSHPDLDPLWSTDATTIEHDDADRSRWDKIAALADDGLALSTLAVCWQGGRRATNCGRCEKCLRTMTALDAVGAGLDRFDALLTPDAVRALAPPAGPAVAFVEDLLDHLAAGSAVRGAWASLLDRCGPPIRLVDGAAPVAGPGTAARIAPVLERLGRTVEVRPSGGDRGDGSDVAALAVGWGPGEVPLRPASVDADAVTARLHTWSARPLPWIVAEPLNVGTLTAADQGGVADLLTRVWGPGLTYLPGLSWAPDQEPALGPATVARLLAVARVRAWWRDAGPLDPLRVVESIEHGCLPLQVMAPGAAVATRRHLRPELASVVVDPTEVGALQRRPGGLERRLHRVAAVVLAGSIERDLAAHLDTGAAG